MTPTPDPTPTEYQDSITGGLYALKGKLESANVDVDRLIERSIATTPKPVASSSSIPKLILLFALAAGLSVTVGAGFVTEVRPMVAETTSKATKEITLVTKADNQDAAKDYAGMLVTADELNMAGLVAAGAYYEGLALFNTGQEEGSANAFTRAYRLGHPFAKAALAKVRK